MTPPSPQATRRHLLATARDLATLLPLDLTIEDYSTNEKITYLPRKLID